MTKPPDARTVLPGQPVGSHNEPWAKSAQHPDAKLDSILDGLQRLHDDAKRWLTESDDRPNLRAAESRIAKLLAFAAGESDRLEIRHEPDDGGAEPARDDFTARVLSVLHSPEGRIAIADALRSPLVGKRCLVPEFRDVMRVVAVEATGMLRVRGDAWSTECEDMRVRHGRVEWIDSVESAVEPSEETKP